MRVPPAAGALIRNDHRKFGCLDQVVRIENNNTAWTTAYDAGQEITIVLKNGEGSYVADERTLDMLEAEGRVVARYVGATPTAPNAPSPVSPTRPATSSG